MSVLVFIPMYNCASQIARVLGQLENPDIARTIDGVVCIDNRSSDNTAEIAAAALENLQIKSRVILRNHENYGLGGSHKVAIAFAQREGYAHLIVLHGDDQGDIVDILRPLQDRLHENVEFVLGARFMPGSRLQGYSALRTLANRVFNAIFSLLSGKKLFDLGSGLNLFRVSAFDDGFHLRFADDLTFNYYLILAIAARDHVFRFFPLTWREDDQVSNARLGRMGLQMLRLLGAFAINRQRFLTAEHRDIPRASYPATEVGRWQI